MPNSCGPYNPNGCSESCQQCYEKVIAGVMEYRCYGQCVVVDAYGIKHLGPGLGAPAGWTPSAGGLMMEMIENEIANINNGGPIPTSQLDCCNGGPCAPGNCWSNGLSCRCSQTKPISDPGKPDWKPFARPASVNNVNRLTQTTVEEQKAALATARAAKFETNGLDPVFVKLCKQLCDDALSRVKVWLNDWYTSCKSGSDRDRTITTRDGVVHPYCYYQYNAALKGAKNSNYNCKSRCATPFPEGGFENPYPDSTQDETPRSALQKARKSANFEVNFKDDPTIKLDEKIQSALEAFLGSCGDCKGANCPAGSACYNRTNPTTNAKECKCSNTNPNKPGDGGWMPRVVQIPTTPTTTALTPTASGNCCLTGECDQGASCWTDGNSCRCSAKRPDVGWSPSAKPAANVIVNRLTQTPTPMPPMY